MSSIELNDIKSVNNSLILGFVPGTKERVEQWSTELTYASFESYKPEDIRFLVTGNEDKIIGCLIVKEQTGEQLFSHCESDVDAEELEDWVDRKQTYTYISALEIWEQYQDKGFGTIAVEQIKASAKHSIVIYSVGESMSFWNEHAENVSGYWFLSEIN